MNIINDQDSTPIIYNLKQILQNHIDLKLKNFDENLIQNESTIICPFNEEHILQRLEFDRERHKRIRERIWIRTNSSHNKINQDKNQKLSLENLKNKNMINNDVDESIEFEEYWDSLNPLENQDVEELDMWRQRHTTDTMY